MKNLNKNTSREEFNKRISLNDTSGMDLFDQDALEGYSKNPESFRLLEKLDNKFRPNIKVNYFLITLFSFITIIGYFVYTNIPTTSKIQKRAKTVSSTNTNISDEQLYINSKTTNKSTFDKKIKSELFVKKNNSKNNSSEINHGIEINLLNKKGIKEIQSIVSQSKIKKISAKERYIDKFLIVDYSVYRSTPINESNALKTGTPANVEYTKNTNLQDDMKDSTTSTYFDFLEETLSLFKKNEFTKANLNFQTILLNYPDDINALFYQGICLIELGKYEKAIENFNQLGIHQFENFGEDAFWLKAKCLIKLKKTLEAKILLKQIIQDQGFYLNQAKIELEKL